MSNLEAMIQWPNIYVIFRLIVLNLHGVGVSEFERGLCLQVCVNYSTMWDLNGE